MKTVQTWMGHSSVTVTIDRYRPLLRGSAAEAQGIVDTYLKEQLA